MKKTRATGKINRNNNTIFNHLNHTSRVNPITQEDLVGSMWLQDDNPDGVKITELNSSNSDASPKETRDYNNFSHTWSYINNDRFQQQEDRYRINEKAREKRRLKNMNTNQLPNSPLDTSNGYATENVSYNHIDLSNATLNHQMNCFTIINKHVIDSDTGSDNPEYEEIDFLTPRDYFHDSERWEANNTFYDDETMAYEPEKSQGKRTIWIYSFKNKQLLPENDFKLDNLSSKSSSCSTSCSAENIEEDSRKDNISPLRRISSPIPTYVPRLNLLGPTLPTVSEVTEPSKVKISESINNEIIKPKQNGWFINDKKKVGSDTVLKHDTSTNVIEWMGLSPRERRRRFRNSNINEMTTLPEVNSYAEALLVNYEQQQGQLKQNELSQVVVDVDVHIANNGPRIESPMTHDKEMIDEPKENVDDEKDNISSEDTAKESRKDDRGDHIRKNNIRRLQIRVSPKRTDETKISDPIDKLESDNWILEVNEEKQTATYDYDEEVTEHLPQADDNANSASRKLWKRNFSLMKPPEWAEYLPIGDSPILLHLSLHSLDEIKQTWYKRIFKYFKCCTRDQS